MKTIIILPNYSQSDEISVLYSEGQGWKLTSYSQVIPRLKLPKGCGRGIPAPVLRANPNPDFILGQLVSRSDSKIAIKSCNAGKDTTGRSVFITAIAEGADTANFHVDIACLNVADHSDAYPMDDTQREALKGALDLLNTPSEENSKTLDEMWKNANNNSKYSHFTSVSFEGVSYLPDSEKAIFNKKASIHQHYYGNSFKVFHESTKKNPIGNETKNNSQISYVIIIIIFLVLLGITIEIMHNRSSSTSDFHHENNCRYTSSASSISNSTCSDASEIR